MKKNFLRTAGMFALLAVLATSCKKDAQESFSPAAPKVSNSTAKIAAVPFNTVLNAAFTTPLSSPGGSAGFWGDVYYDLANNTTTSTESSAQALFNGTFDGNINGANGYNLAYKDVTGTSLEAVSQTALNGANAVTTLGSNTSTPGWYVYNVTTHTLGAVANRYAVLYKGSSVATATELYVLQIVNVGYTADGTSSNFFGQISFRFKKLV